MGIKHFIIAFFMAGGCVAQTDILQDAYYEEFKGKLSVQAFTLSTTNNFSLFYAAENLTVDVVPNSHTTIGAAAQYDFISLSFGFAPKFFTDNKDNQDSKMTSFTLSLFPGRVMQHFDFIYQKGMSLESGDVNVYLPELKSLKIGGSTSYMFNPNFSFKATAFQNAKQLKSAGTFAPTLSYYYTELNSKKVPDMGGKIYFVDVALAPAYYYNWVIAKNFLLSGGASLGAGFTTTVDDSTSTSFLVNGSLHLAPGYNGERWFGGLNTRVLFFNHGTSSNVQMNDAVGYATFFVGYRFDAPGVLEREKNKIESKL
jgi:hypothetical protein